MPRQIKTYVVTVMETRTYDIIAEGNRPFEAEQDAISRFKRARGVYPPKVISQPRTIRVRPVEV
jgi:hypothetical protein